jgi:hypothetical protein
MSLEQYKDANRKDLWDILQIQMQVLQAEVAKNVELEKKIKITYIEGQIEGIESVDSWIDGYYAPCVVGVVDELCKELNKLEQGK